MSQKVRTAEPDDIRDWRPVSSNPGGPICCAPYAAPGHVTGGTVFGYDNVRVDGHVERRINEPQAAVIRPILRLCAAGIGYTSIAKQLNAERALTRRPTEAPPRLEPVEHARISFTARIAANVATTGRDGGAPMARRRGRPARASGCASIGPNCASCRLTCGRRRTAHRRVFAPPSNAPTGGRAFTGRTGTPRRRDIRIASTALGLCPLRGVRRERRRARPSPVRVHRLSQARHDDLRQRRQAADRRARRRRARRTPRGDDRGPRSWRSSTR